MSSCNRCSYSLLFDSVLDPLDHPGVKHVGDVVDGDADRERLAGYQTAGVGVAVKIQLRIALSSAACVVFLTFWPFK